MSCRNQSWASWFSLFLGPSFQTIWVPGGTRLGFPSTSQLATGVVLPNWAKQMFKQLRQVTQVSRKECVLSTMWHRGTEQSFDQVPGLPKQFCEFLECHLGVALDYIFIFFSLFNSGGHSWLFHCLSSSSSHEFNASPYIESASRLELCFALDLVGLLCCWW